MLSKAKKQRIKNIYLCGVIDSEASFGISVKPHNTAKFGWVVDPKFSMTLDKSSEHVLKALQQAFGCGRIIDKSGQENCRMFIEQSRRNLVEKIIPFLERYPLEMKTQSYEHFKEVVLRLEAKEHLTAEGFLRLAAFGMSHTDAKGTRKYDISHVLETMEQLPDNAQEIVHKEIERIKTESGRT